MRMRRLPVLAWVALTIGLVLLGVQSANAQTRVTVQQPAPAKRTPTAEDKALRERASQLQRRTKVMQQKWFEFQATVEGKRVEYAQRELKESVEALDKAIGILKHPDKGFKKPNVLDVIKILITRGGDVLDTLTELKDLAGQYNGLMDQQIALAQEQVQLKRDQEQAYAHRPRNHQPPRLPDVPMPIPLKDKTPEELAQYADAADLDCWETIGGDRCFENLEAFKNFLKQHPDAAKHSEAAYRVPDAEPECATYTTALKATKDGIQSDEATLAAAGEDWDASVKANWKAMIARNVQWVGELQKMLATCVAQQQKRP